MIPSLLFEKERDAILRAWVPGCSSGEPAYALAMMLIEQAEAAGRTGEVRVFATDTDRAALALGREGIYAEGTATEFPPSRLRRFFDRELRGLRAGPELRRQVFFAVQDFVQDPPYPLLDLVYCAHLPAWAGADGRRSIVRNLRNSLRPGGILVQSRTPLIETLDVGFESINEDRTILRRTEWTHDLLSEGGVASIFVDREFVVRSITKTMMRLFDLGVGALRVRLDDLASRIGDPALPGDIRAVFEGQEPVIRQVQGPRDRWYIRRLQPAGAGRGSSAGVVVIFLDISPIKEAEWRARTASTYFQSIVETIRTPLVVLDTDLRVRSANSSYYRALRTAPGMTEGRPIHELDGGRWDSPRLMAGLVRIQSEGVAFDGLEIEVDCGELGRRTLQMGARRVEGLPFVLLSIDDITERRRTEAALEEHRRRLQSLFENSQDAILLADDHARYIDANPAACALTGYDRDELLERTLFDLTPEAHKAAGRAAWREFLERGRMQGEYPLARKDGAEVTVEYRAVAHILPGLHLASGHDVTERKRLEKEIMEIASAEQRRIGQELHDDAGQILTGLGLMARVLADRLEGDPDQHRIADRIHDGIGEVLDRIRDVSKGLIPVEVDADGLMAALAELARGTDGLNGVACRFDCDEPVTVRDNTTATQLYRIAQEAVTNAIRHGSPAHIWIILARAGGQVHLEVHDDGKGLPPSPDKSRGRGLSIMRYRAGLVGASLAIAGDEDRGTAVRCTFSEEEDHVG